MFKLCPLVYPETAYAFLKTRMIKYEDYLGNEDAPIAGKRYIRAIHCAPFASVTLCYSKKFLHIDDIKSIANRIEESQASMIITHIGVKEYLNNTRSNLIIFVNDPLQTFIQLILNSTVDEIPSITNRVNSVYIEEGALIGSNTYIRGNNYICTNTVIGDNVTINPGTVIGTEDFGKIKLYNSEMLPFPHIGGVIINNNVQIGANTCINKGTLENTIINEGSVVGNNCHIAHQVIIGKNSRIGDNCTICGSVIIGDDTYIAPGTVVVNGINIGSNTFIGIGSVVIKDIKDDQRVLCRSISVEI